MINLIKAFRLACLLAISIIVLDIAFAIVSRLLKIQLAWFSIPGFAFYAFAGALLKKCRLPIVAVITFIGGVALVEEIAISLIMPQMGADLVTLPAPLSVLATISSIALEVMFALLGVICVKYVSMRRRGDPSI